MQACLVTRPSPEGQELCKALSQHGIPALHQPLIKIEAGRQYSELAGRIQQAQIIIAVSQHAVYWANHALEKVEQKWPTSIRYVAIGQKTAHKLSKVTQQKVHYPEVSDSEHLLTMTELTNVGQKRILILRGNGGRDLIYSTLAEHGALVEHCEAYQRIEVAFNVDKSTQQWQQFGVDTLVVTSGEQLNQFVRSLSPRHLVWLRQLRLVVPSQRIVEMAQHNGFQHIINSQGAANPDLLRALSNR